MSDIKFACPHCTQHIACDVAYCHTTIDCPACGNEMIVPRLTGSQTAGPPMLLVASAPGPKRPAIGPLRDMRGVSEQEWEEHTRRFGGGTKTAPVWLLSLILALIIAFVLRVKGAGIWPITICILIGAIVSAILITKDSRSAAAYSVLRGLSIVVALCLLIPVIALGILFVGCMGCH